MKKKGRCFDQVATSEGCIIEVRGHEEIPFASEDIVSVNLNHKLGISAMGRTHRAKVGLRSLGLDASLFDLDGHGGYYLGLASWGLHKSPSKPSTVVKPNNGPPLRVSLRDCRLALSKQLGPGGEGSHKLKFSSQGP